MKISLRIPHIAAAVALGALLPASAFAAELGATTNLTVSADTDTHIGAPASATMGMSGEMHMNAHASTTREAGNGTNAKAKADEAIDKRIADLNKIISRFGEMKKLTGDEQASLTASINAQISTLTTLKAKIDADTDTATLKADIQSITKDNRTYLVVLPQGRILAASDRIQTIIAQAQGLETKLQARITAAQTAGKDVSAANTAFADMKAKLADANIQATAAVSETSNLKPDGGNAIIEASNKAALKDAAAKIKAATQDLAQARADIGAIVKATGSSDSSANATVQAH